MEANHSLQARQLLAALRQLPESNPEAINGVREYVAAADAVAELETKLVTARCQREQALGTVALAVFRGWKPAELTPSVRTVLRLTETLPQWIQAFGQAYEVPPFFTDERRLADTSWSNDSCPSFTHANLAQYAVHLIFWCDHPVHEARDNPEGERFTCTIGNRLLWSTNDEPEAIKWALATLALPYIASEWAQWGLPIPDIPHLRSLITGNP